MYVEKDLKEAVEIGYEIYPLKHLKELYERSCGLRFIQDWGTWKQRIPQFHDKRINWKTFEYTGKV